MIEPIPIPSTLLKVGAAIARWTLWLLASAWIAMAVVWGGLHFLIVPRIAELRPWVEQQVSQAVGAQVHIGAMAAKSNGLIPSLELREVRMLDAQHREVLRLPAVLVALSPRSVLSLGFEQLYIDSPVLDVRRTADGQIWVAGFSLSGDANQTSAGADWVFSQTELAIVHGTVRWTDELRGAPELALTDVDVVLRNRFLTHAMRLDAKPPAAWGERLSLSGVFKHPLLSRRAGQWKDWTGQMFASFPQVDLAQLRRYADLGVDVAQGVGGLRAWVDINQGVLTAATTDLALTGVNVRVSPQLDALAFQQASGRLGMRAVDGGFAYFTQDLAFDTKDGLHWPGGNIHVGLFSGEGGHPQRGDVVADRLDLAALAQIADRLPLGDEARAVLRQFSPHGLVERVQGSWVGALQQPGQVALKGRIVKLAIPAATRNGAPTPGFKGVDLDFEFNPAGGKASIAVQDGFVDAPGVFEDPVIPVDHLSGEVLWKTEGERLSVQVSNLKFGNADAQGELQAKWRTAEAGHGKAQARFPGVLDMQGSLSRAEGARVYRYFPQTLGKPLRDYLHDAITAGTASAVKFKVKGNLQDFPFNDPKQGEFRISANVHNMTYAFAPNRIVPQGSLPWPVLSPLSGELEIDHGALKIKGAHGGLAQAGGLQVVKVDAVISDLYDSATLAVAAEARGPLQDMLGLVNNSPLGDLTNQVLARTTATGTAEYRFKLGFPLRAVEHATVQGAITLTGNDLQISPDTPRMGRARGVVAFTESGFSVAGGQARILGGDARIEGGLSGLGSSTGVPAPAKAAPTVLRVQGTASAEGLRQASELGLVARLAQYASGAAAYTAQLGLHGGFTELQINSNLVGLALALPAPFSKIAEMPLPLRFENSVLRSSLQPGTNGGVQAQDQLQLEVGRLAQIVYMRDISGPQARVLRGAIGVGLAADESAPLPAEGVAANISMERMDLDAWMQVLSNASGTNLAASSVAEPEATPAMDYLPTRMALRAHELILDGRKLNRVVVGGAREGQLWRANLDAAELNGYVEYRQPTGTTAGRLYGRLARLAIGQSTAQDVENMLDEQPASIPALDVVVEDFELRGKKLGRLEIDAVNLGVGAQRDTPREWRLNRFNIITPEAVFTAGGNWAHTSLQPSIAASRSIKERRRTVLNFKLDIRDGGELLNRFGMPGVVRKSHGKIEGQVAWMGSPITLDYPSLGGSFNVNVENGQFLKAEPGIAKLLGVLSLQALPRRLTLDFRDVFSEGFSFDFLRGDVVIAQGIARTNNLQMKGVNAAVLMEGQADIAKETQAIKVVVVPEINAGSASLIASAINPLVGLTTFLAQMVLRRPLIDAATQEFFVDGTWVDPRVTKVNHQGAPTPQPSEVPQ
ncbi:MAG: TIGR02099 family protein [Burkholderiales bacterium RIFCSPLOWO2_12_FULL_61_40]|nr:MAG: TIGR02099 family protein [Burkholderiales bacterium RIFCSPLOWO2_12_FULL_61_40]